MVKRGIVGRLEEGTDDVMVGGVGVLGGKKVTMIGFPRLVVVRLGLVGFPFKSTPTLLVLPATVVSRSFKDTPLPAQVSLAFVALARMDVRSAG